MGKERVWLEKLRERKGISQASLAEITGITQQQYSLIENGQRGPSPKSAQKIAKTLGFDWKLFFEDESPEGAER
ncbi:MAG: helix-turn-helix transcriptional regulator [Defluviitaleaceae bacterium]|nr:helix-turn-helix transcriptional regulator [Defluviitaleaceae bacterium]